MARISRIVRGRTILTKGELLSRVFLTYSLGGSSSDDRLQYATYNALSDGGDRHDNYYADRYVFTVPLKLPSASLR